MGQIREEELLRQIALTLKKLREEKGISQDTVFNDTNIHIARIEVAKVNLSVSTLARLCDYFEISVSEFFARMGK